MTRTHLVKTLKENVSVPIHLHTHNTTGTGDMTNLMAVEAGVDIVDCRIVPLGKRHLSARHRVHGGYPAGHRATTPAWIWPSWWRPLPTSAACAEKLDGYSTPRC